MIIIVILFWVLCLIVWFLKLPTAYINKNIDEVRKFLYFLFYKGYAEENPMYNGGLAIKIVNIEKWKKFLVYIIKNKVKGNDHMFVAYIIEGEDYKLLLEEAEKRKKKTFILKLKKDLLLVDCEQDIEEIVYFINYIWEKIFKEEKRFAMNFTGDMEMNPEKTVYGRDIKELEDKGVRIDLPIKKWQWVIWRIKNPRGKL